MAPAGGRRKALLIGCDYAELGELDELQAGVADARSAAGERVGALKSRKRRLQ